MTKAKATGDDPGWTRHVAALTSLDPATRTRLDSHPRKTVPPDTVLFRPGDAVQGYVVVLSGRIAVHLTGPTGRDILLYEVTPGDSCLQSTLGLMGGDDYSAEARTETETTLVLLPRTEFLGLLDSSPAFRRMVFAAFADRMQSLMQLLEKVAFLRVEARLARALLDLSNKGEVTATQADLATQIGSVREVVSRRLSGWARAGTVAMHRGGVSILDPDRLQAIADEGDM